MFDERHLTLPSFFCQFDHKGVGTRPNGDLLFADMYTPEESDLESEIKTGTSFEELPDDRVCARAASRLVLEIMENKSEMHVIRFQLDIYLGRRAWDNFGTRRSSASKCFLCIFYEI
jgi:rubredoxin